jgi:hypothetical protein
MTTLNQIYSIEKERLLYKLYYKNIEPLIFKGVYMANGNNSIINREVTFNITPEAVERIRNAPINDIINDYKKIDNDINWFEKYLGQRGFIDYIFDNLDKFTYMRDTYNKPRSFYYYNYNNTPFDINIDMMPLRWTRHKSDVGEYHKHIQSWITDIENKLEDFLKDIFDKYGMVRIYHLLKNAILFQHYDYRNCSYTMMNMLYNKTEFNGLLKLGNFIKYSFWLNRLSLDNTFQRDLEIRSLQNERYCRENNERIILKEAKFVKDIQEHSNQVFSIYAYDLPEEIHSEIQYSIDIKRYSLMYEQSRSIRPRQHKIQDIISSASFTFKFFRLFSLQRSVQISRCIIYNNINNNLNKYIKLAIDNQSANDIELEKIISTRINSNLDIIDIENKKAFETIKSIEDELLLYSSNPDYLMEQEFLDNQVIEQERLEKEDNIIRLEYERLEQESIEQERLKQEKLAQERLEKLEQKRLEQERRERIRLEKEKGEKERRERERLEHERREQERIRQERIRQERLEKERISRERIEQVRREQERLEQERVTRIERERIRLEQERFIQERLEQERIRQERIRRERLVQLEQERINQLEQERLEQIRLEKETIRIKLECAKLEHINSLARLEHLNLEREKLKHKNVEGERSEQEQSMRERLERDKLERERVTRDLLNQERLEREQKIRERLEREQEIRERLEREKLERERLERERLERERLERERLERERLKR